MKRIGIIVRNCVKTSPVIYAQEMSLYPEEQAAEGRQDWEGNDELGSVKDGRPPPCKWEYEQVRESNRMAPICPRVETKWLRWWCGRGG